MPSTCSETDTSNTPTALSFVDSQIRHIHAMGPANEYSTKEHELVISNLLAACIGDKRLWEKNSNVRPKIDSGLKSNKFCNFTPQN